MKPFEVIWCGTVLLQLSKLIIKVILMFQDRLIITDFFPLKEQYSFSGDTIRMVS
jgi:hypothetical protein